MITAAALTFPHLQPAVTSASQPCRAAPTTVTVTCYYAAKVTIYSCRIKDQLSRVEQGFATELKDAGNRWAHGDPFSADDTYRALDTMERLLTPIST
jgi:HEPN superfamily Swt1-like protein